VLVDTIKYYGNKELDVSDEFLVRKSCEVFIIKIHSTQH